ncbi:hypothetical protein, partial [Bradyrhizobium sp.]|uniref:hypothetical protein n=1 Tax=Bradyrhizobium sp. TaxID=376 RepID=UPI003BAF8B63
HNLVLALIQNKPIIVLSDHGKLHSLANEYGLPQYLLPLQKLSADVLIGRFEQLEKDAERLRPYLKAQLEKYRRALDNLYAAVFADSNRRLGSPKGSTCSNESAVKNVSERDLDEAGRQEGASKDQQQGTQ